MLKTTALLFYFINIKEINNIYIQAFLDKKSFVSIFYTDKHTYLFFRHQYLC